MYITARVHCADILDEVFVEGTLFIADWRNHTPSQTITVSTMIPGEGEDDPREWLKQALIGLIEVL